MWLGIILDDWLLFDLEYKPLIPGPSSRIKIETDIPSQAEAHYAPSNGRGRKPGDNERRVICIIAIGWNPGSNDWVRATNCKNKCADDAGICIKMRLLFPSPAAAQSEPQHPNCYGESKDCNDGVGVEVNENCVGTCGIKMDRHKDHDNSEDPVKEKGSKGRFLRVLLGVHPRLL